VEEKMGEMGKKKEERGNIKGKGKRYAKEPKTRAK
jgi:hypothetical protein